MCIRVSAIVFFQFVTCYAIAQKKPLDHSVYDSWQSIGERAISNSGKFVVYTVNPQEGDGNLYIQAADGSFKKEFPRGYNATISEDNQFVVFRIRPVYKDVRDARIKKKKPEDMPKDSLGIFSFTDLSIIKIPRVKGYKMPDKGSGWLAYQLEKALPESSKKMMPDSITQVNMLARMVDSLTRLTDSLRNKLNEVKSSGLAALAPPKKEEKKAVKLEEPVEEGTELVLRNLQTGEEKKFSLVNDYLFSETGNVFVIESSRKNGDPSSKASVIWMNMASGNTDTVFKGFNDAKSYSFDKAGSQLAFAAERDSSLKALRKFFKLYYYAPGMDSAVMRVDRKTAGVKNGMTVNDFANIQFSRDGRKLFFQLAPIRPVKDTSLVDFETARMDIWHYNDDYLVPQQLRQLDQELRRGYAAVIEKGNDAVIQLASDSAENVSLVDEGNADYVLATSTKGNRIALQWQGFNLESGYLISTKDGSRKDVVKNIRASYLQASPFGNYVIWYDWMKRQWFTYNVKTSAIVSISKDIKVPVWDEDDDHPDDPPPHGLMRWDEGDKYVFIYDKYDVWRCDPQGKQPSLNFTKGYGRNTKTTLRYVSVDEDERFIKPAQILFFRTFNEVNKYGGTATAWMDESGLSFSQVNGPTAIGFQILRAKASDTYLFTRESFDESPNLYVMNVKVAREKNPGGVMTSQSNTTLRLTNINPQQKNYNWFTVDLVKWKMFDGKMSEGLLYKPENFDSTKKYPVIFYFYEKNADTRYQYKMPEPVRASINIPYFVSNGYIVFDPNIYYKNGEPGESAYNSVVSAAKYLSKFKWIDSTKMAIQGHSWGGYQVAYLVTRTNMFAAAESGAPVANMTSAYGGMRWGPGINRQFQYERSQSRIGATLWQRPDLYVKNSPLFHADKIHTPLLILDNDQDDAVPWYQGIEFFTAMRRLNKKVWMVTYNGEPHGIMERRNRKDWSIRLAQFFDFYLKGAPPAKWITEGVPATLKGIDWGTSTEVSKGF